MGDGRQALVWRTLRGRRIAVHTPQGSYASRRAPVELREAERIATCLADLLEPAGQPPLELDIYLIDAVDAAPAHATAIVRLVAPERPGEPIAYPLTRQLVERWYGPRALTAAPLVDGLAGLVAARAQIGPPLDTVQASVNERLAGGHSVSPLATDADGSARTAFVAFLIERYGPEALRAALAGDQAAYQRPLGELEQAWLAAVRRKRREVAPWRSFLQHLLPLIGPFRWRLAELLACTLVNVGWGLTLPLGSKYLVDTVIPSGSVGSLLVFALVLLLIYVINTLLGTRRAYVAGWITQQINAALAEAMFAHLQRLAHSFYERAKVGDLMARLSSDLSLVQQAVTLVLATVVFLVLTAGMAAVAVLVLNPLLGGLVLLVVPLFVVSYTLVRTRLEASSLELQASAGEAAATVEENLSAHGVIKAFGLEERAVAGYRARLQTYLRAALRVIVHSTVFETSVLLATMFGQLLVLALGGYLVMQGQLSLGSLLAFIGLLPALFQPIATLSSVAGLVQQASGALDRVTELLDEPITVADQPGAQPLLPVEREIRFEGVTFGYSADRPVLHDIDLVFPAGSYTAIVGPSGSGKSSLANLLLRFWDPDRGRVLLDGCDLRDVTLASLRSQIGLVFQDTFVFDTTVRDNIGLGRPDASDEDVLAAARGARLDEYIRGLPARDETVLGERGVRMSGGQRQRLALARALVRNPRVLILDEATSALDARTENEILESLRASRRRRTTIAITHRLSMAAGADRVLVLADGRLVEQGTHAELLASGGLYRRLWDEQTGAGAGRGIELDRLRAVPLLAELDSDALHGLAQRLSVERYAPGDDVVREGEAGGKLFIVAAGGLEVLARGGSSVAELRAGDYFGEMALLSGQARSATVRAVDRCELYALDPEDFVALLRDNPAIAEAVEAVVAQRRAALDYVTAAL